MGVEYRIFLLPRDRNFAPGPERIHALVERLRAERWALTPDDPVFAEALGEPEELRPHRRTGGWAEPFVARAASPKERWEKASAIPVPASAAWIAALRDPASPSPQADELALHFSMGIDDGWSDHDLPYPLAYGEDESGSHDILIHASRDFVWHLGGSDFECSCGEPLAYEIDPRTVAPIELDQRIRAVCGACSRPFDGDAAEIEGVVFRSAVVVDFSKGWPLVGRAGRESPSSHHVDASVLRSPYGDPAPPINAAFSKLVEETLGVEIDVVPEFY